MKYLYGPVKSRRLGLSLGVSLTPYKICSFDCVYCQLGGTITKTEERKEYAGIEEILSEVRLWLQNNAQEEKSLNYITLSGLGEPTLNIKIGQLIAQLKKTTTIPVAVITNSFLLNMPSLRQDLLGADLIAPSLNAANYELFKLINRPCKNIKMEETINGLVSLRNEFKGQIWLEIMLVKGMNDKLDHIRELKEIIDKIKPDKIQLNSPVRTTAEPNVLPVDKNKLEKIREILGDKCEVL